ncbi:hypothetical protein [Pseudoduganella violaceinigra]|uniref:hypothetical protein n=1 Tax=Pseudoduganella violaceinigra TaxID=246602 RepID=UPI00068748C6|nr:hypothetical protein [Pseudoduganella violaceinigra]
MNSTSTRAACASPELRALLLAAGALLAAPAWAGRPLATDDATILDPHDCQVEAWHQHTGNLREWWAMPACRVGDWELGAGKGQARAAVLQAKTVLRTLGRDGWALGLTLASQHGAARQDTVNFPLSMAFMNSALLVHLNAGWMRQPAEAPRATWSAGGEFAFARRWSVSLESYGSRHRAPTRQLGLRYTLIDNRLDMDASVAKAPSSEPQLGFGLTWSLPHLLY